MQQLLTNDIAAHWQLISAQTAWVASSSLQGEVRGGAAVMDVTLRLISGTRDAAEMINFRQSKWKSNSKWKWKWEMENEQFSAVFKWVFFSLSKQQTKSSNVIDGLRERGKSATVLRGKFSKFLEKKKISIELILNAALSAACLLPHWKVRAEGEQEGGGWLQFYKASVWPRLALIDFCVDICALGYRARCRPLPVWGLVLPRKRVATHSENCLLLLLLCLWCHNKRIMLPLVECESLPLVCQLPFVFALLFACFTACLLRCSVFYSCCFVVA